MKANATESLSLSLSLSISFPFLPPPIPGIDKYLKYLLKISLQAKIPKHRRKSNVMKSRKQDKLINNQTQMQSR
jgi:hypothetical protein